MWLEAIGWLGSGLIIWSLMQARVWRFRVMNLAGAVLATFYNIWLAIWPFAAMNAIIVVIDVYWLLRLHRERHSPAAYTVVEVSPAEGYVRHFLSANSADIAKFAPAFVAYDSSKDLAFLIQRGDETVGLVTAWQTEPTQATITLDYVTPRFRDFTPAEFVFANDGAFAQRGIRRLIAPATVGESGGYYPKVGFAQVGGAWVRDYQPA